MFRADRPAVSAAVSRRFLSAAVYGTIPRRAAFQRARLKRRGRFPRRFRQRRSRNRRGCYGRAHLKTSPVIRSRLSRCRRRSCAASKCSAFARQRGRFHRAARFFPRAAQTASQTAAFPPPKHAPCTKHKNAPVSLSLCRQERNDKWPRRRHRGHVLLGTFCCGVERGERKGERERKKERERETERQRDRERDRDRETQRERKQEKARTKGKKLERRRQRGATTGRHWSRLNKEGNDRERKERETRERQERQGREHTHAPLTSWTSTQSTERQAHSARTDKHTEHRQASTQSKDWQAHSARTDKHRAKTGKHIAQGQTST